MPRAEEPLQCHAVAVFLFLRQQLVGSVHGICKEFIASVADKSLKPQINFSYAACAAADIPTAPRSPLVSLYWLSYRIFWVNGLADARF